MGNLIITTRTAGELRTITVSDSEELVSIIRYEGDGEDTNSGLPEELAMVTRESLDGLLKELANYETASQESESEGPDALSGEAGTSGSVLEMLTEIYTSQELDVFEKAVLQLSVSSLRELAQDLKAVNDRTSQMIGAARTAWDIVYVQKDLG